MKQKVNDFVRNWRLFLIIVLMLIAMIWIINVKDDFHVDELLSFSLSNNEIGWFHFDEGVKYEPAVSIYNEQLSAHTNHRFAYYTVWNIQSQDVHPPFYYATFHTVCSFFPGKVSVWQPAIINFIFAIATVVVVRLFLNSFINSEEKNKVLLIDVLTFGFALSPGVLDNVSFFRMYVVAMFAVTWVSFVLLKIVINASKDEVVPNYLWALYLIASVLCALTHYYCVMYLVLIDIFSFLYIFKRDYKNGVMQLVVSIAAALGSIVIFPAMISQLLFSGRGVETRDNMANLTLSKYIDQLKIMFRFPNRQLFGGGLLVIIVVFIIIQVVRLCRKEELENCNNYSVILAIFILPVVIYFFILSRITVYADVRYIFPIYGVVYILGALLLHKIMSFINLKVNTKYLIEIILVLLMLANSYRLQPWNYLFLNNPLIDEMMELQNVDVLVLYNEDTDWETTKVYRPVQSSKSVTFINSDNVEAYSDNDIFKNDELIVFSKSEDDIEKVFKMMPNIGNSEMLGTEWWFKVCYLN